MMRLLEKEKLLKNEIHYIAIYNSVCVLFEREEPDG